MPELPEVETVMTHISPLLIGSKIISAKNYRPNLRIPFPDNLSRKLEGRKVSAVKRRAKYLLCYLDNQQVMVIHLGMSGKIFIKDKCEVEKSKHDHFMMEIEGNKTFIFNDARRFGLLTLIESDELPQHKLFKHLGVEPLVPEFDAAYLGEKFKGKEQKVKQAIMDQNIVVGVGNIYASEALFTSNINPNRKSNTLSKRELSELVVEIKKVLSRAIAKGGSTIKDFQVVNGESGYFQHEFRVYGKENKPCFVCNNAIRKITLGGRSTFYCSKCQI